MVGEGRGTLAGIERHPHGVWQHRTRHSHLGTSKAQATRKLEDWQPSKSCLAWAVTWALRYRAEGTTLRG